MKLQKIKDSFRESLRLAQDDEQRQKIMMSQQMFENELDELDSIKKVLCPSPVTHFYYFAPDITAHLPLTCLCGRKMRRRIRSWIVLRNR